MDSRQAFFPEVNTAAWLISLSGPRILSQGPFLVNFTPAKHHFTSRDFQVLRPFAACPLKSIRNPSPPPPAARPILSANHPRTRAEEPQPKSARLLSDQQPTATFEPPAPTPPPNKNNSRQGGQRCESVSFGTLPARCPRFCLWVKNRWRTWDPGRWNRGLKRVVSWWFYFDPYISKPPRKTIHPAPQPDHPSRRWRSLWSQPCETNCLTTSAPGASETFIWFFDPWKK